MSTLKSLLKRTAQSVDALAVIQKQGAANTIFPSGCRAIAPSASPRTRVIPGGPRYICALLPSLLHTAIQKREPVGVVAIEGHAPPATIRSSGNTIPSSTRK
ncbi:MAG: hypothetical protein EAZ43_04715 [Betaproteobacteria bacterium]|nr:MAG: hypothetical protein EAZ43_04715 [Betaproteobacteria bacterium]